MARYVVGYRRVPGVVWCKARKHDGAPQYGDTFTLKEARKAVYDLGSVKAPRTVFKLVPVLTVKNRKWNKDVHLKDRKESV